MDIEQHLAIIAGGEAHLEKVAVTKTFLREVLAKLQAPRVCSCCQQREAFDVVGWLGVPSRDRPLAAAAAVNLRR